jgi:DNA replication protein DnaC
VRLARIDGRGAKAEVERARVDVQTRQAREEHWSFEEYLHEVFAAEQFSRRESTIRQRAKSARFPELKTLDTFDFGATDGAISAQQVAELSRGEWVSKAHNVIFAGPIGTGKTHLAIALGVEIAKLRKRVMFARAEDVVRELLEARDARELGRMQRRLASVDLLILDELGFVPFDRAGGELLSNMLADRYERRSVLVTTNTPGALMGDKLIAEVQKQDWTKLSSGTGPGFGAPRPRSPPSRGAPLPATRTSSPTPHRRRGGRS